MTGNQKCAMGVSIAAVVVFLASFTPWGTLQFGAPQLQGIFGSDGPFKGMSVPPMPMPNMQVAIPVTARNGHIQPAGIQLPNWLVVLAAAVAAGVSWLKASKANVPQAIPIALAVYGLLHTGFAMVVLAGSSQGSVGIGVVLTVVAFLAMLSLLLIQARTPAGVVGGDVR